MVAEVSRMMNRTYSELVSLQCENRALRQQIKEFENGSRYLKIQSDYSRVIAGYKRENQQLKKEVEKERVTGKKARDLWIDQCNADWEKYQSELKKQERQIEKLEKKYQDYVDKSEEERSAMIADYEEKLSEKDAVIHELSVRVAHLEAIRGHDGTNTGIPTSQTPTGKKKLIPNSRRGTGKPKGGQKGHKQHKLEPPAEKDINDEVQYTAMEGGRCPSCDSKNLEYIGPGEPRYEYDVEIQVMKRRIVDSLYRCNDCGEIIRVGSIPVARTACQYGPVIQSLALSLTNTVNASINKTAMFLAGIANQELHPSEGYIAKLQARASKGLTSFYEDLRILLLTRPIIFWDDTVIFIHAQRACFRFYGDDSIAFYTAHLHKDMKGIQEDHVLPLLTEETMVMHDHNMINYHEDFFFQNLECAQHLQRDCQKNADDTEHPWSSELKELIAETIDDRKRAIAEQQRCFRKEYIDHFEERLEHILQAGWKQYEENKQRLEKYGASVEKALLTRLNKYRLNYFAWVYDFSLPTTNNLSERSLRSIKTKMKVSGQFESEQAAQNHAVIRSYVETCRRNGINEITALKRLSEGNPYTVAEIFDVR